ncbi:uncharacterized protein LOC111083236 isoform X2 [Limulus polyphemus]|uniref:Uncharacterized protein LOC111083236 isoform X2 n=1 Tax=Limulus polyphemus TaxID=6850 RepID=A0ABM1RVB3_LIMPO|nr:uncharacterized protein LOC111083236 isoform X2 [Limulus polyphemus]
MAKARTPPSESDQTVEDGKTVEDDVALAMATLSVMDHGTMDVGYIKSPSRSASLEKHEPRITSKSLPEVKKKRGQSLSKTNFGSQSLIERGTRKKRRQMSISDPTPEITRLTRSPSCGFGFFRKGPSTPSSSSSHSSGGSKFRTLGYRPRLHSDSFPEQGCLLPRGLKDQHAAHICGWSESDSGSRISPAEGQTSSSFPEEGAAVSSSVCTLELGKKSDKKTPRRQKDSKFEVFVPLCDVQQSLKKGEVIEEDQMDIYIGNISKELSRRFAIWWLVQWSFKLASCC